MYLKLAAVPHVVVRTDGESGALETDNLMKLSTVAGQLRIKERRSPPQTNQQEFSSHYMEQRTI